MTAPPFPVVGVFAPIAASLAVWLFTNSTFAIIGAVIAPTMVLAHYVDARRRARRDQRAKAENREREDAARRTAAAIQAAKEFAELARRHPSIADIARTPEWCPPNDGNTAVRAGRFSDGGPWLVDVAGGVAVAGSGPTADAVWASLVFHATAQLGEPVTTGNETRWANGAWLSRVSVERAALSIRCDGHRVMSVTVRGQLPESQGWESDDVRSLTAVLPRMTRRTPERLSVSLSSETPHVLIAGRTGSGKSHALAALVVQWSIRFSPREFQFIGIDFKGGATLTSLRKLPHHLATITDLDTTLLPRALAGTAVEMIRRERELLRQGVSAIERASGIPRLAVVVDEVHEMLRRFPESHEVLADIARRGRSLGIHLVVATQHPAGVLRESVLGNIAVRICLAMNSTTDVTSVLGRPATFSPARGTALVTQGDGFVATVLVSIPDESEWPTFQTTMPQPLWQAPLDRPVPRLGRIGFGLVDDVSGACHRPAVWSPSDGDVLVIGEPGSGRTSVLEALSEGHGVTWVREPRDLSNPVGILVIDDLDVLVDGMTQRDSMELIEAICRERHSRRILVSTRTAPPRALGSFRDTLTLRRASLDEHRATGAPPETFDPASAPGVGTWRGYRVVLYARTESTETASMP